MAQGVDTRPPGLAATVAAYALVLVLTVLCAVWGAFLVPLRLFGVPVPLSVVVAVVGNAGLGWAAIRITGRRIGGVVPGLGWLLIALAFGTPRPEGDVVIPSSAMGYAFLGFGTVAATAVLGLRPTPRSRTGR